MAAGKPWHDVARTGGLIFAPIAAAVCFGLLPESYRSAEHVETPFSLAGRATCAVMLWMAIWWLTEAVHITVTALLPLVIFPLLGIATIRATAMPYADPVIFLFMGGFLLAISMQHWGLGRRIALLTIRCVGTQPRRMIGGFMLVTAVLSAFVSNTATTAMMSPIALGLVALLGSDVAKSESDHSGPSSDETTLGRNFSICLLLGIAYAASIGGVATIIGTPPNVFLRAFLEESQDPQLRQQLSFARWMLFGVPLAALFLPIAWLVLTRFLYPIRVKSIPGARELIEREVAALGRPNRGEWVTFLVFCLAVGLWVSRPLLLRLTISVGANTFQPFHALTDAGIAMLAAMLLFVTPSGSSRQKFVLSWKNAEKLPFGILLLFGGGLSLAAAISDNGVAEFIGAQATRIGGVPVLLLVVIVTASMILLTEVTSNAATAATLVPVLAALAPGMGVHPYLLIFPATLAASCAFMLPVATPPNAIVFGSGQVEHGQMMRAGIWLNIIGVVLITFVTFTLLGPVFGIES